MSTEKRQPGTVTRAVLRAMKQSGLSRYRLALDCGLEQAALCRFVHGRASMTLESADALCRGLGLVCKLVPRQRRQKGGHTDGPQT